MTDIFSGNADTLITSSSSSNATISYKIMSDVFQVSELPSNSGLFNHKSIHCLSCSILIPRDAISAGLCSVGT